MSKARSPKGDPLQGEYPRAALTVDCVVFGLIDGHLRVLLVQRDREPFRGQWALPGGFVRLDETLEEAARRELREETGLDDIFLEQLYTFGTPDRDPRERVVSVAYFALVNIADHRVRAATDARDADWYDIHNVPALAFDHGQILDVALARLKGKVKYQPIGFELLPEKFTLSQLQSLYETVLEKTLDKRNFRKKILSMGLLVELDEQQRGVRHRAARFYRFDRPAYERAVKDGFEFAI